MDVSSLGKDLLDNYGYAIDHHTINLWFRMWKLHDNDVRNNGTPPPCKRVLDITTSCWNKCMGNVDTIRKVLAFHKVKRGSNTGPGSMTFYVLFGYILYNAYCVYIYSMMKDDIDEMKT